MDSSLEVKKFQIRAVGRPQSKHIDLVWGTALHQIILGSILTIHINQNHLLFFPMYFYGTFVFLVLQISHWEIKLFKFNFFCILLFKFVICYLYKQLKKINTSFCEGNLDFSSRIDSSLIAV